MKICPKCKQKHEKPGIFCSRTCANSRGPRTDDFKNKVRTKAVGRASPIKGTKRADRTILKCVECGIDVEVLSSRTYKHTTCGSEVCKQSVRSRAGRVSASISCKRSADEIRLYNLIKEVCDDAMHNHIIANGWDADIVIPSIKVAIMWNGPWHYKQMPLQNHSLKQVQNRDRIKLALFTELGWKVYVFEDSVYTPEEAFKALNLW